ncbi:DNA-binding domain-containing protein [Aestuariicella sp. G3-2]|uniref:HvfC/BufC N-terminal domain-containing protein n=1 Tax=Pseudomaricurvus albidus TaxID=2842452 RepID=UPI001C0AADA9|nr:DNA-binding domain-containing protein [Aestuariicella albida]MBU3071355.1 DNA-binding domain-containing protein [Aestuariicella albida]
MLNASETLIQQQSFLSRIYQQDSLSSSQTGLNIYRNNFRLTAARSLSLTYPVIARMIGSENMLLLAERLLKKEQPSTGDWADWGEGLPEILADSELHAEHIYLTDVANMEWMRHQADKAKSTRFNQKTLEKLSRKTLSDTKFVLSDGLNVFHSEWPVDRLWEAHRPEIADPKSYLSQERFRMQSCYLVIYQQNRRPQHQLIDQEEYHWLSNVTQGLSIDALIDTHPNFDFVHWLPRAIEHNWLLEIH